MTSFDIYVSPYLQTTGGPSHMWCLVMHHQYLINNQLTINQGQTVAMNNNLLRSLTLIILRRRSFLRLKIYTMENFY